jgi:hypothetical protein
MRKRFQIRFEHEKIVAVFRREIVIVLTMLIWLVQALSTFLVNHSHISERLLDLSIAELLVLVFLLWALDLGSKEVVEFTPDTLTHRSGMFGFSHTKMYHMREIQSPHFAPSKQGVLGTPSGLAFLYDGQEVRLCRTIKQPEAKEIVNAVLQQFPKLKFVWGSYAGGEPEPEPGPEPPFIDGA